jgi:hypothetical protein
MNTPEASFLTWQQQFRTNKDCLHYLKEMKWPNGFMCPQCGHDNGIDLHCRELTECSHCHKQTSVMSGTLFHGSHLPLLKWFWALYFIGSDKGSISALRLSKLIEVNWKTARLMLTKVRAAMGHRDSLYRLSGTIALNDAFVGVKHKSKRVRGAEEKTPVIIACENKHKKVGFIAIKAVKNLNFKTIKEFVSHHFLVEQHVGTNAYPALNIIDKTRQHEPKVTPCAKVDEWLPCVHIPIGNLKMFLLGTFHGVTGNYLQEYLNEFCYRYNRRFVEKQIPNRLLNLAIIHTPLKST